MLPTYLWVVFSYLLYQAAVGGLFFVLAKVNPQNPFFTSGLLMVEPILMLLIGIRLAKFVDTLRQSATTSWFYSLFSSCTLLGFLCLYTLYIHNASYIAQFVCYGIVSISFISERIYRQRLARDLANATDIPQSRVNAIANLANRGAPVLSPFVLLCFPSGLNTIYLVCFIFISLMTMVSFCHLSERITQVSPHLKNKAKTHDSLYPAEKLGMWHVWHLFLMNLVLGGFFMVLSESILTNSSLSYFLQGPSLYFAGFWLTMLLLTIVKSPAPNTPMQGLYFTAALGFLLIISAQSVIIAALSLFAAGVCYGFAINRLGTFVQQQLDHDRYSYYETRAQTAGRIALLMGLGLTALALDKGYAINLLRAIMGVGVILSATGLGLLFIPIKKLLPQAIQ